MKKILFSIALLSLGTAQAQISINEIYLQSGSFFGQNKGSLADFQTFFTFSFSQNILIFFIFS